MVGVGIGEISCGGISARPILIDGVILFLDDLAVGSLHLTVQLAPCADGLVVPVGSSETTSLLSEYQCRVKGKRSLLKIFISQGRKLMIASWIDISLSCEESK